MLEGLKLIECPRDAMQGIATWIPTETKVRYINQLLRVGFDTIDFGSFVSPKAIPQMRDTADVLSKLNISDAKSKLLAIVANLRGAEDAIQFGEIQYLGYPFSISETFQMRNTNATIEQSLQRVSEIQNLAVKNNRELVVYVSMGFGNPYGDPWSPEVAIEWSNRLYKELGVKILALSDTIGIATPEIITQLFENLIPAIPDVEFGAHLHTTPFTYKEKVEAAYNAGCRRFDGALKGLGGCPMAADDLTGNMPMEMMVDYFDSRNIATGLNMIELEKSISLSAQVFPLN